MRNTSASGDEGRWGDEYGVPTPRTHAATKVLWHKGIRRWIPFVHLPSSPSPPIAQSPQFFPALSPTP